MRKEIKKQNMVYGGISTGFLLTSEIVEMLKGPSAGSIMLFLIGCFVGGKIIGNLIFLKKNKDMLDLLDQED